MRRASLVVAVLSAAACLAAGSAWAKDEKAPDGKPVFLKYKCSSCHAISTQGIVKKAAAASEGAGEAGEKHELVEKGEAAEKGEAGEKGEGGAAGTSVASKAPDLSGVGLVRTATWMSDVLQKKEKIGAKLHIKKFRGTDEELARLTGWLATLKDEEMAKKLKAADAAKAGAKAGAK